jgi:hypothetical protein
MRDDAAREAAREDYRRGEWWVSAAVVIGCQTASFAAVNEHSREL